MSHCEGASWRTQCIVGCSKNAYGENKYLYAVKINKGKPH